MFKTIWGTWCSWFITFASHFEGSAKGVRFNSGCVHRNDLFFFLSCTGLSLRSPLLNFCLEFYKACFICYVCPRLLGHSLRRRTFISSRAWDGLILDLSTCVSLGSFTMPIQTASLYLFCSLIDYMLLLPPCCTTSL
jgi:hypothetical protein